MKFRVVMGQHREVIRETVPDFTTPNAPPPKWKIYKKGEIVESNEDLVKKHVNKFERVISDRPEMEGITKENGWDTDETAKYAGASEVGLKILSKGDQFAVVDIKQPFKALNEKPLTKKTVRSYVLFVIDERGETIDDVPPDDAVERVIPEGYTDATERWPDAREIDLMILCRKTEQGKEGFVVVERNNPSVPLTDSHLKEAKVQKFIEQYMMV